MDRAIVHMVLHDYYIECERLSNSSLIGRPIIIGGGTDRGTVAACSREAARYGVRLAMPIAYALKLCPDSTLLKGDYGAYRNKSKELTEIDPAPCTSGGEVVDPLLLSGHHGHGPVFWMLQLDKGTIGPYIP